MAFSKVFSGTMGFMAAIVVVVGVCVAITIVSCTALIGGCAMFATGVAELANEATEGAKAAAKAAAKEVAEPESPEPEGEPAMPVVEMAEPGPEIEPLEPEEAAPEVEPEPPPAVEPVPENPDLRLWSDATGDFQVEAEFVNAGMGSVKLRKADGTEITVRLDRLSEADQEWLRERARRAE